MTGEKFSEVIKAREILEQDIINKDKREQELNKLHNDTPIFRPFIFSLIGIAIIAAAARAGFKETKLKQPNLSHTLRE